MNDPAGPSHDQPDLPPDPVGPSPDWDSVFHRARRQVLVRMLLVGAVAALSALFLLGGGLSAQGTVSWRFLGHQTEAKSAPPPKHKHRHKQNGGKHGGNGKHPAGKGQNGNSGGHHHHHHKQKQPEKHQPYHQWDPCQNDSAAAQQYCDAEETAAASSESTVASEPTDGG